MSGARHGRTGTAAERRALAALEAEGYLAMRAAGSLGLFDLIGVGADVRLVQVKAGGARPNGRTLTQFRAIAALAVAPFVRKEIWIYRPRARAAEVHALPDAAALASWRGRRVRRPDLCRPRRSPAVTSHAAHNGPSIAGSVCDTPPRPKSDAARPPIAGMTRPGKQSAAHTLPASRTADCAAPPASGRRPHTSITSRANATADPTHPRTCDRSATAAITNAPPVINQDGGNAK